MVAVPTAAESRRLGVATPSAGSLPGVWRRFRRHRLALLGLGSVTILVVVALAAPLLSRAGVLGDPYRVALDSRNAGTTLSHPLGTDYLGRDLLARLIYGARISLSLGLLIQVAVVAIGGAVGLAAGYVGGWVDNLLMRLADVTFALPDLLFVLVIVSVLGPGYWNIVIAVGLVNWAFLARLVRGQVLAIKEEDYVAAARTMGTRRMRMLGRHVIPNLLGPVIVTVTFGIPAVIFLEAFLSFLGVGLRPPVPSWGVMIREGYEAIFAYPQQVTFTAIFISVTVLSFNFIGDGLRDALDPRSD
jgi:oligopeptide transport system permease protein